MVKAPRDEPWTTVGGMGAWALCGYNHTEQITKNPGQIERGGERHHRCGDGGNEQTQCRAHRSVVARLIERGPTHTTDNCDNQDYHPVATETRDECDEEER